VKTQGKTGSSKIPKKPVKNVVSGDRLAKAAGKVKGDKCC